MVIFVLISERFSYKHHKSSTKSQKSSMSSHCQIAGKTLEDYWHVEDHVA